MADRVALSVQASQEQQNNNVKHPEIVSLFVYFILYIYFDLVRFEIKSSSFKHDDTIHICESMANVEKRHLHAYNANLTVVNDKSYRVDRS